MALQSPQSMFSSVIVLWFLFLGGGVNPTLDVGLLPATHTAGPSAPTRLACLGMPLVPIHV